MYLNSPQTAQVSVHLPHSGTAGRHLFIGPDVVNLGVPVIEHLLVLRVHVDWALLDDVLELLLSVPIAVLLAGSS